jgi:endonuclease/exonuclease/phosphatase family metal-dependent hydrolase
MPRFVLLIAFALSVFATLSTASEPSVVSHRQTVGPAVIYAPHGFQRAVDRTGRLVVVNWNVHVGHGNVPGLIDMISSDEHRHGFGKPEFVLLLEESFRQSTDIPDAAGINVPRRIAPPDHAIDIEDLAHQLGWWMYYVPSMRNGNGVGQRAEDRGNAILSSLPLDNVEAVELPFAVQRRVALIATVTDMQKEPMLRIAVTHFDTRAPLLKGWIFGGPAARNRQAKGFATTLEKFRTSGLPLVFGGDLNTYLGSKSVIDALSEVAPRTDCGNQATHSWGLTIDHLFSRIPESWTGSCVRARGRFGSDHYPLVLSLNVPW